MRDKGGPHHSVAIRLIDCVICVQSEGEKGTRVGDKKTEKGTQECPGGSR